MNYRYNVIDGRFKSELEDASVRNKPTSTISQLSCSESQPYQLPYSQSYRDLHDDMKPAHYYNSMYDSKITEPVRSSSHVSVHDRRFSTGFQNIPKRPTERNFIAQSHSQELPPSNHKFSCNEIQDGYSENDRHISNNYSNEPVDDSYSCYQNSPQLANELPPSDPYMNDSRTIINKFKPRMNSRFVRHLRSSSALPTVGNNRPRNTRLQRSESENGRLSFEVIDIKGRNLAYKLCKLLWTLARGDWSRLCQRNFAQKGNMFEIYMTNCDILTHYITMIQSIHIQISAPNFLCDLQYLHKNHTLVALVESYFDCLFEIFETAKTKGKFHYFPDVHGLYGPSEDVEYGNIIVKFARLEDTTLEIPVNGLYGILKELRPILLTTSNLIRKELFQNFIRLISIELQNAAEDFKIYNKSMGESFHFEKNICIGLPGNVKSILKQPDRKKKPSNRVRFGQAHFRDLIVEDNGTEGINDTIVERVFDTSESFKHERSIQRLLLENYKLRGIDVDITPREMYDNRRKIVEKIGYVKEITKDFDNPRTVLRLSPPSSPEMNKNDFLLLTNNVSNSYPEKGQLNYKRKLREAIFWHDYNVCEMKRQFICCNTEFCCQS